MQSTSPEGRGNLIGRDLAGFITFFRAGWQLPSFHGKHRCPPTLVEIPKKFLLAGAFALRLNLSLGLGLWLSRLSLSQGRRVDPFQRILHPPPHRGLWISQGLNECRNGVLGRRADLAESIGSFPSDIGVRVRQSLRQYRHGLGTKVAECLSCPLSNLR